MIDQNPIDVYAAKQGTGSKVIGSSDSLDSIEKEIQETDNRIFELNALIKSKTAEIEAIKSGSNLSDLEMAAREEYARTGSSSAMQGIENAKISREMTAKTQDDINEEILGDTVKEMKAKEADLAEMYKNGEALTATQKRDFLKEYAEYENLARKLIKHKGSKYNDKDGDGLDDGFETMKDTVSGSDDTTKTDTSVTKDKVEPDKIKNTAMFVEQWPNYTTATEQKTARETLAALYGPTNYKLKGGSYSLNLDNSHVAENKAALEKAGFNVYSFSQASNKSEDKAKTEAHNKLKELVEDMFGTSSRTQNTLSILMNFVP